MPSSILINDGRRSASPDRRVTFGNIERYDIMTSNEIKSNMNQKREMGAPSTVNGNYPMTRLDNRIRKALLLGFAEMTGDQVTYDEIIDFLLEFKVIANQRVCTERQITAIVHASFPRVITKPSAKYNIIFVNLENKSDDVIKEELVRVTTEPIIDPASLEAQAWIQEADEDDYHSAGDGADDEELIEIENKKQIAEKVQAEYGKKQTEIPSSEKTYQNGQVPQHNTKTPTPTSSTPVSEAKDIDSRAHLTPRTPPSQEETTHDAVHERSPRFSENLNNRPISKSTGDVRSGFSIAKNTSFPKKQIDRSVSVNDVTKKADNVVSSDEEHVAETSTIVKTTSTSNLTRKRSFLKSTSPSLVGSIRDKFRSSLRRKSTEEKEKEKEIKAAKKEESHSNKNTKKEESHNKNTKKETHEKKNAAVKRSTSKTNIRSAAAEEKQAFSKIAANNEIRLTVNKQTRSSNKFGGSSIDIRKGKPTQEAKVNKSLSNSATDIRSASFRNNALKQTTSNRGEEVRGSYRTTNIHQSVNRNASDCKNSNASQLADEKSSNFVRATGGNQGTDVRASVRKRTSSMNSTSDVKSSSVRKPNEDKPTITKSASIRTANSNAANRPTIPSRNTTPRENTTAKRTGVRRSNSRTNSSNRTLHPQNNSNPSSASTTPNISRENSRTNLRPNISRENSRTKLKRNLSRENSRSIPVRAKATTTTPRQETTQQEKDLLRIAKAFQKATNEIEAAKDKVEQFMINVVLEDIESSPNNRLNIDELYDHIRHQMIVSQKNIFDGYRTDIRVDMSQYFELFFTALASHFNRVGCEITTDSSTQERICYLTHIKLTDFNNNQDHIQVTASADSDDDMQASYV